MKPLLALAVVIQLFLASYSDGLTRSLAELSAFLCVVALVISVKHTKSRKVAIEVEEL